MKFVYSPLLNDGLQLLSKASDFYQENDNRYLKLDASNDPVTGQLNIGVDTTTQNALVLQTTDDDSTNNLFETHDSSGTVTSAIQSRGTYVCDLGTDYRNLFIGFDAGNSSVTGVDNLIIGQNAGQSLTSGGNNVFLGSGAGASMLGGARNVAIGRIAYNSATTGSQNVAIGDQALQLFDDTGSGNFALGYQALRVLASGRDNISVGQSIAPSMTYGTENTFVGGRSAGSNVNGSSNTMIGYDTDVGPSGSFAATAIGVRAECTKNRQVTIGDRGETTYSPDELVVGGEGPIWQLDLATSTWVIKAQASQTANIWENRNSSNTVFNYVDSDFTFGTGAGRIVNTTTVNASTYDLLVTDDVLLVAYTTTGAVTSLTLPTAQCVDGRRITIKDAGGNAATYNITVDTGGAETIDGRATYTLNNDYESINLVSNGSHWYVI